MSMIADAILILHFAWFSFVVLLPAFVLIGWWRDWRWVRNRWLRWIHLAMIGIVALEAVIGARCPLTVWESEAQYEATATVRAYLTATPEYSGAYSREPYRPVSQRVREKRGNASIGVLHFGCYAPVTYGVVLLSVFLIVLFLMPALEPDIPQVAFHDLSEQLGLETDGETEETLS